jgi:hypothetical protein
MKEPNPNDIPDEKLRKPIRITDTAKLPTQEQLAMIAAMIAKNINDDPVELVNAAVEIWNSAGTGIENYFVTAVSYVPTISIFKSGGVITRESFFKGALPKSKKNRTAEIGEIGKDFLRHLFFKKYGKDPNGNDFDEFYSTWNAGTSDEANALVRDFDAWYKRRISKSRSVAGKKQRKKRRKARPQRKALREIVKRLDDEA